MIRNRSSKLKNKSASYFDRVTVSRTVIPEPERCYPYVIEALKDLAGSADTDPKRILDVGCGSGRMLQVISSSYPGRFELTGVDISPESLAAAKAQSDPSICYKKADAEHLPFSNASFDVVLCMHSFHHYPAPWRALGEMHRVLRRGGVLYLIENEYTSRRRIVANIKLLLKRFPGGDLHMYSRRQLRLLTAAARFRITGASHIADHSQFLKCMKP